MNLTKNLSSLLMTYSPSMNKRSMIFGNKGERFRWIKLKISMNMLSTSMIFLKNLKKEPIFCTVNFKLNTKKIAQDKIKEAI